MNSPAISLPGHPLRPKRPGFSLVEVVMAVGILSFSFLAIVGLLAGGLENNRRSADRTSEQQIMEWCKALVRNGLATEDGEDLEFDRTGLFLNEKGSTAAHYRATLTRREIPIPGSPVKLERWKLSIAVPARNNELLRETFL